MEETPKEWFKTAAEDLEAARILYQGQKYQQAIFYLQQANEKVSKGLLIRIGFLPEYQETTKVRELRRAVGVYPSTPRIYGHAWHRNLFRVLEGFIGSTDSLTRSMVRMKLGDKRIVRSIREFRKSIPDLESRLNTAKKVKTNPNPSLREIDGVVRTCNQLLDSSAEAEQKAAEAMKKIKFPDRNLLVASIEKYFGTKLDQETLEKVNKIYGMNPSELVKNVYALAVTLLVLAVLNTYLLPHEHISRYPDSNMDFAYDREFPLVKRFYEISDLIMKCLELATRPD